MTKKFWNEELETLSRDNLQKLQTKVRLGLRSRHVKVLNNGDLPRATHKAKRVIDLRG